MRTARLLTGTVRAAAALGAGLALSAAPAAYADAGGGGRRAEGAPTRRSEEP
ncbi:hypothetical protein G6539_27785 [Streptomyces albidoflavus]|nr:hypothetical protein [Streptomyces albidoflavus]